MSTSDADLAELKQSRSTTRGCITRIKNLIESKGDSLSEPELECRLGILESYFKQILSYQGSIEKLDSKEIDTRYEVEDLYCQVKSKILALRGVKRLSLDDTATTFYKPSATYKIPEMKLPQFAGKYSDFPNFIGTFTKLVDKNPDLTSIEKFNYLLGCLTGPALRAIKGFDVTEADYSKALNRLKERFDNKCLMFQEHITSLFNLPKMSKGSAPQLRSLIDNTNAHFSSLQSLGTFEDIANALIVYIVATRLDADSLTRWDEANEYTNLPSWKDCARVLENRCKFLEARDDKQHHEVHQSRGPISHKKSTATSFTVSQQGCNFCKAGDHQIYKCNQFTNLPIIERFTEAKKLALCINCLGKGHSIVRCTSRKCRVCKSPHHTLLHRYNDTIKSQSDTGSSTHVANLTTGDLAASRLSKAPTSLNSSIQKSVKLSSLNNHIFLATALVYIEDPSGCRHTARVLLDSASQLNLITEDLVHKLRLHKQSCSVDISGIGNINTLSRYNTQFKLQSRHTNFTTTLIAGVLPSISGMHPEFDVDVTNWQIPSNIELADPHFYKANRIDILLGAETFFDVMSVGQIRSYPGYPILQKTLLGWIVSGRYQPKTNLRKCFNISTESAGNETHESLERLVEEFWKLETIIDNGQRLTDEQAQCEEHFLQHVSRQQDGRIIVRLPFKDDPSKLGNSFNIAKQRFLSLERRLNKDPTLKEQYRQFLEDYLTSKHMEEVTFEDVPPIHYYLPHQCVLKSESSTTKLRVVFDASCRTSTSLSLNDILMVGPVVQDDLFSIILRFRCYKFALTADISAMYRQIHVYPGDKHFQYILWRDNVEEDLRVFKLNTVTYGTAAAPYLATRSLKFLADEYANRHPLGSKIISHDFYVDDLITGADTQQEITQIRTEVEAILYSAQMHLRKWCSNDTMLLETIPLEEREKPLRINDSDVIKTLGIIWEPTQDEFQFTYKSVPNQNAKVTKRTILSDLSRLFDPLGLINPIVVKAKIFMQELWILKLNWDESVPVHLDTSWKRFREQLSHINNIRLPRFVLSANSASPLELHGFCDASQRAYGCCIYTRSVDISGNPTVRLLTAKSKVAPIKVSRSLPCLELCGAELLAKLITKVVKTFSKPITSITLWTDSEIVLDWLSEHPSSWKTFVAHRVSMIQELTSNATWRHVSTHSNPADIVSRGASAEDLLQSIWYTGPEFLKRPPNTWPQGKKRNPSLNTPQRRNMKPILSCIVSDSFLDVVHRTSNFLKNCRQFAYVFRFIHNCRRKSQKEEPSTGLLTAKEIDNSFMHLVWCVQQKAFAEEIDALRRGQTLNISTVSYLNPFLEELHGIELLRVGGRLRNSTLPYEAQCPILLPKNNYFVTTYVTHLHLKHFHAGAQALVSIIRQRFWIINARDYARRIVRSCIHCFRYKPRLLHQIMGDLPKHRIIPSPPFQHTGVDFCGPLLITSGVRGRAPTKVYIAVFVCFTTKAAHLELVSDLTSKAFIAALKRFIARRSLCKHLYCDNATNFVGARRELEQLKHAFFSQNIHSDIVNWCIQDNINFHHIPPRAPHFGGIWEAAVKSAKTLLMKVLHNSLLTWEELNTLVIQVESILNSRPITSLSSDPNDEPALTPAHFLNQAPIHGLIEPDITSIKESSLQRWRRVTALQQHFWKRWSSEYVLQLQQRGKWIKEAKNIKLNTIVLVHDDNTPPQKWLVGKIVAVFPGKDDKIRVVDVQTKAGVIRRAIHKLAPLPLNDDDS